MMLVSKNGDEDQLVRCMQVKKWDRRINAISCKETNLVQKKKGQPSEGHPVKPIIVLNLSIKSF